MFSPTRTIIRLVITSCPVKNTQEEKFIFDQKILIWIPAILSTCRLGLMQASSPFPVHSKK